MTYLNKRGLSILEVLAAAVLVSGVLVAMSLLLPKSFQVAKANSQRMQASMIAQDVMQGIKAINYPIVKLTDISAAPPAPFLTIAGPNACDCRQAPNMSHASLVPDSTMAPASINIPSSDITYTIHICVNRVEGTGGAWTSRCPLDAADDSGLKNIRVHVSWVEKGQTQSLDLESIVARL